VLQLAAVGGWDAVEHYLAAIRGLDKKAKSFYNI
jgi:hypothetical protein